MKMPKKPKGISVSEWREAVNEDRAYRKRKYGSINILR
jgi:hypothetical protein